MTTESAEQQNHDSLWTCTRVELQAELDSYAGEFGVEKWTSTHVSHFLELKFHLVRDTVTKTHIDEVLRIVKSDDIDTREYRMVTVLAVLQNEFIFKTPDDIEALHVFRDGVYVRADPIVKGRIEELLKEKANSHFCSEVLEHFKRRSYVSRDVFNQFHGCIPVQNGLLSLETMQLGPHDPDKIFTFKIATTFVPDAQCPKFMAFLDQTLPDTDDQLLVQEFAGYTLLPELPHHKFMVFLGSGRNGKGALVRTLEGVLGRDSTTNIPLERLTAHQRFEVVSLFNSLMNSSSEPDRKFPYEPELLKRITGDDRHSAEVKNKQERVKFTAFTKFFLLANHLPVINDDSFSFWDRVLIVEFRQRFTDECGNRVPHIEKTWLKDEQEKSGILNWMLEGLKRLNANSGFTRTRSHDENMLIWKQTSDPVGAFLSDPTQCTYHSTLSTTRNDLYVAYKAYVETFGLPIDSLQKFADRVRRQPGVADRKKRVLGASERVWIGIGLIKTAAREEDESLDAHLKSGADGADGAPFTHSLDVHSDDNEKGGEYVGGAPSAPSAPPSDTAPDAQRSLPESPDDRWTTFLGHVGKRELSLKDLDGLYTGRERNLVNRDLKQWEREGRVCWIIDEEDRHRSHWKIMEGDL